MWSIRHVRLFRGICTLQTRSFWTSRLKGHEKRKYDNWTKIDWPCIYKTWVCMCVKLVKIRRLGSRKSRHPHYQTGNDTAGHLSHPKCHIVTNDCDSPTEFLETYYF